MTSMEANIKILGVRIDNFSVSRTKEKIESILESGPEQKFIVTLNPEILLKAYQDKDYKNILNSAELNLCDGFGIKMVSFLRGKNIKARFTGVDLVDFLLSEAVKRDLRVLVVAPKITLSKPAEIEEALRKKYPNISAKSKLFGTSQDFFESGIMKKAEIVFVSFGAPEQEKFIWENRLKFPKAKILVGVGGAFDFLTGKIKRAPGFMRLLGLEWLWRLIQEPKRRIVRIWKAVFVFPVVAFME